MVVTHIKLALLVIFLQFFLSTSRPLDTESNYNAIDKCWRRDPNWANHRTSLANCAKGFGSYAMGGIGGGIYIVTRDDDNALNPLFGTLRYGVTRDQPLWIVFARDMEIHLQMPLFFASHKTIDARGAKVTISNGACITLYNTSNVIIHGLTIHDCQPSGSGDVLIYESKGVVRDYPMDGDGISVISSRDIWLDHNTISHCSDGLIDVTLGSTAVTISNNRFFNHNEVMLLGNSDTYTPDLNMRVTVAFNHFGPDLMQRMPRCRLGYVHVANNYYEPWGIYAIGGSSNPTILSEANWFMGPSDYTKKQVTQQHECTSGSPCVWRSIHDMFLGGSYFTQSGWGNAYPTYDQRQEFEIAIVNLVPTLTKNVGTLDCLSSKPRW
ncbi:hypothetical protein SUGI_0566320 [Cryptomeria japonica]|nr:hypothetical protein SUGI_0566320 [Cryptomeria japonica]